jgi:hypothetical protein
VRRPLAALAAAALLLPAACTRDLGPEATYRALTRAVADRDEGAAWALLSRGTQRWLETRAREAARTAPGVVAPSARQLLLGDAALTVAPPSVIEVVRNDGKVAVLRVQSFGGAPADVELVREGGAWKVEIGPPRAPGPAAPAGPSGWTGPGPSAK